MTALTAAGLTPTTSERDDATLLVEQVDAARVGAIAHAAGVELHHLAPADTDLEQAFLRLVTETGETPR
jgi:ABC-2 type transport system ATP-binding protein